MAAFINEFKAAGYGVYWAIVEMLHNEGGFMPMDEITYTAIAKDIEADAAIVQAMIEKGVSVYNLFVVKDGMFTANRVLSNLNKRQEIKEQRSKAGKASALAKQNSTGVEHHSTPVQQNSTNKKKGKESKGKESINTLPNGSVASDEAHRQRELVKEYENLVQENTGKDDREVFMVIRQFIEEKKPSFAEPFRDAWNIFAPSNNLESIQSLTTDRRTKIRIRTREPEFDFFKVLTSIRQNSFYRGENERGWKVDFNYVIESSKKYLPIIERYKEHA